MGSNQTRSSHSWRAVAFPGSFLGVAKLCRICWQAPNKRGTKCCPDLLLMHSKPRGCFTLALCLLPQPVSAPAAAAWGRAEWPEGPWGVLTPAPGLQHCTLVLCWRWEDFFLSLLLVHLVQRLRRHPLWEQNVLMVGPVFIYLQPFMKGVWRALWAWSKKLTDSHFWWLSRLLWLSQRHDFGVATTCSEHAGSLKHFEWKWFYCQSTWFEWLRC